MTDYLDASVLVSAFVPDVNTPPALAYLRSGPDLVTSAWAAAEYSSALWIQRRNGRIDESVRASSELALDAWLASTVASAPLHTDDAAAVRTLLRSLQTPLRAPDALHLVICRRLGTTLVSFDIRMRDAARELNLLVRVL